MHAFVFALGAMFSTTVLLAAVDVWAAEDASAALYVKYCSSCHGVDGKGRGPVSSDLKVKVPDLTTLAKNNKGVFPLRRVMSAIDGTRKVRGHGDPAMPVWGEVFKEEHKGEKYAELTSLRHTQTIADYIAKLQR
ncbi:MAG TPA: c-type cytochrome [Verrucomicrobiae bacterium]|nr:c-type cytochrome [Verrucomicrobiae bacterium]